MGAWGGDQRYREGGACCGLGDSAVAADLGSPVYSVTLARER